MGMAQEAWVSYREAAGGIYPATLSEGEPPRPDQAAVDELLARSDALGKALADHLGAENVEERELAALQLQARPPSTWTVPTRWRPPTTAAQWKPPCRTSAGARSTGS